MHAILSRSAALGPTATLALALALLAACSSADGAAAGEGPDSGSASASPPTVTCGVGLTECGGTCVDEQTDYANCGGCGLACTTGCVAGTCTTILAGGIGVVSPAALAVEGTRLYWTDPGMGIIASVPVAGGAVSTVMSEEAPDPGLGLLAVDSAHLYWTHAPSSAPTATSLMAMPIGGGPAKDLLDLPGIAQLQAVGGDIYALSPRWIEDVLPENPAGATAVASGIAAPLGAMAQGYSQLFWATDATTEGGTNGELLTQPAGVEQPVTLASGIGQCRGLAVALGYVYWTDAAQGLVMKVPLDGGAATTLASHQAAPTYLTVDAKGAYFIDSGDDTLMKVGLDGGTPVTLAKGGGAITAMAVDETSLYWAAVPETAGQAMGIVRKTTPR
jgi:hypothetical protein